MKDLDLARPEAPSVMVVDAGDVFVGGRYHSLVPILREVGCYLLHGGRKYCEIFLGKHANLKEKIFQRMYIPAGVRG